MRMHMLPPMDMPLSMFVRMHSNAHAHACVDANALDLHAHARFSSCAHATHAHAPAVGLHGL